MFDICMFNVGFGDCFLLQDETSKFLVDCGTCSIKYAPFKDFEAFINMLLRGFDTDQYKVGLISHFHIDHYKGFKIMADRNQKVFDRIYVPYMYFDDEGECILVDLAIYILLALSPSSQAYALARNVLYHIVDLLKIVNGNNVVSLSKGKRISFGASESFDVLWPPMDDNYIDSGLKKFLKELNESTKDEEEFHSLKREVMANMQKWFELTSRNDGEDNFAAYDQRFEVVLATQIELLRRLEEIINSDTQILTTENRKRLAYKSRSALHNNHMANIVFHNQRFLMMGDITKRIVNKEIRKEFLDNYCYIKAPHHGTKTHYVELPTTYRVLISTGERPGYNKIFEKYATETAGLKVCSGGINWCETLDSGSYCGGVCAICGAWIL